MDTMLATMVTTYSKLRQVPKFISRLQAAMVGGTDQSLVSFPAGFLARLSIWDTFWETGIKHTCV
ncbi:hypothetical protein DPMN_112732 [Dreissena polymorpha]|uniref:Uncharacterized protein n=1 Tax=Dreissena polymorpha TaxID=45954 RepID=A0A9D4KHN6_DREPO|nr:hypothetical protein DPMN_112732 [Dreissena polymorpha]